MEPEECRTTIVLGTLCEVTLVATSCNPTLVLRFPKSQTVWMFYEGESERIDSFEELFRNHRYCEEPSEWITLGENTYRLVGLALQGLSEKLTVKIIKCDLLLSPEYSTEVVFLLEHLKCKKIRVEATDDTDADTFNRLFRAVDGTEELVLDVKTNSLQIENSLKTDIVRINRAAWLNKNSLLLLDAKQIHLNHPGLTSIDVRMFLSAWASRAIRLEVLEIRHDSSLVFEEIKFGLITKKINKQRKFQQHKFCSYLNASTERADIVSCNGAKSGSIFFSNKFFIFLAC